MFIDIYSHTNTKLKGEYKEAVTPLMLVSYLSISVAVENEIGWDGIIALPEYFDLLILK